MIDWNATGIYIAFPTSTILKPIKKDSLYQVNHLHTKIGMARKSFKKRSSQYRGTFSGEVEFEPVVQISPEELPLFESGLLDKLHEKYRRIGPRLEWFETMDRDGIVSMILNFAASQRAVLR